MTDTGDLHEGASSEIVAKAGTPLFGVWLAGIVVSGGIVAASLIRGELEVQPVFYSATATVLVGLLLAFALEHGRFLGRDQTAMALSVYVFLAIAEIVALVSVANPPANASLTVATIAGGLVGGLVGLLLLVWQQHDAAERGPDSA